MLQISIKFVVRLGLGIMIQEYVVKSLMKTLYYKKC